MQILELHVEMRDQLGSAAARRYCRAGKIPCVLYGRGKDNVMLLIDHEEFLAIQKAHTAIVRLRLDDKEQTALVREIKWDTFGEYVQHIDLVRVEMEDEVKITIPITYLGVPEGAAHGGSTQVVNPDLELWCRVDSIPSELRADITHLHVGDFLKAGDVTYPPHTRPARPESTILVHCREPRKTDEARKAELAAEEEAASEAEAPAAEAAPE
jgi:large subunit ribosomal protein L25